LKELPLEKESSYGLHPIEKIVERRLVEHQAFFGGRKS